jgi:2-methylaconitate cis-trans-isomerase PrpF
MQQLRIPCVFMRGGTSRGAYLRAEDLPTDPVARDQLILAIYGSPDVRQIDGLGGADSLTSKVAIVGPSTRPDADVDYTFGQVGITTPEIDYKPNCGNISSGVGPFAIMQGWVPAVEPVTRVRIYNTNTRKIIVAEVPVRDGEVVVEGDCQIDGVPGTGAPILLDFLDSGGAVTGKLLPTGRPQDVLEVEGRRYTVSLVDAANPYVFVRAAELGLEGTESADRVNGDQALLDHLEAIRGAAAELYGFVADRKDALARSPNLPKIAFVAPPKDYVAAGGRAIAAREINLVARGLSGQKLHKAYAVTGAICTGAAARVPGTIVNEVFRPSPGDKTIRIGHPAGILAVEMEVAERDGELVLTRAAFVRTARPIMDGYVYVPRSKVPALDRAPVGAAGT